MTIKKKLIKERLSYSGLFDLAGIYGYAYSWLDEEDFGVSEEKYNEKVSGNTRDIYIEWKAIKEVSDYFNIEYKMEFTISGLSEVEVEIDGERKKMNKGKFELVIKGTLVQDPRSKWDVSPAYRMFRDVYSKYIIPGRVNDAEDQVRDKASDLREALKVFFDITARK